MEGKIQTIIRRHQAATGFFTALTHSPGHPIKVHGNFQTVIEELEALLLQNNLNEVEQKEAKALIAEYRELSRLIFLSLSTSILN